MKRFYYSDSIANFLAKDKVSILGELSSQNEFSLEKSQRDAWLSEITILKESLKLIEGQVYFEYTIPRMGRRVDVIVLIGNVVFVLEFKVGSVGYDRKDIEQVWDYALDLKNFHETSHELYIVPVLIATNAKPFITEISSTPHNDKTLYPILSNASKLEELFQRVLSFVDEDLSYSSDQWAEGRYCPTPTIIEAATALYNNHSVDNISRSDAGAINLTKTSESIAEIINEAKLHSRKTICFVTGVPGAGKTLVGLKIATTHFNKKSDLYSVFLSGNGPLVAVLRESLTRDKVAKEKEKGNKVTKKEVSSKVKLFIQNVHHFRDDCLYDSSRPPIEHVALFDEAQRAWNKEQTSRFMRQKKNLPDFNISEPEFLISCLDRHPDWAVIVCLVGGGQEINTGEAGIGEWIKTINETFSHWSIYLSNQLTDSEYGAGEVLSMLGDREHVHYKDELHLAVSMRSFRAEQVSYLIKQILDCDVTGAANTLKTLNHYPIVITRDLKKAKRWLKQQARGSERYGMVVSSQAERLKPHAIDVRTPVDPINWFLNGKDDVRSSFYLEDVATEFHVQGLELDWSCVIWDADLRYNETDWTHKTFRGNKWLNINKEERKGYLKNAYRVLLTRARQGMVIVIPYGDQKDHTRLPEYYDPTYCYLKAIGFKEI